jgi:transcription factor IIIB 90 kDa subunit
MSARPGAPQRAPRLNSIRHLNRNRASTSRANTPKPPVPTVPSSTVSKAQASASKDPPRRVCPNAANAGCKPEDILEHEGQLVCSKCGTVVDSSNIVSDVTFGETATGQAVVQGAHIGDGQRFAHTMGAGAPRGALGQTESRDQAIKAGKFYI